MSRTRLLAVLIANAFAAGMVSVSAPVLAQTSPSGINSTSPGSAPSTGGSYSPGSPLPPIVTTPLGGSMGSSTYGEVGSSLGNASVNSGIGASTGNSGFGSSTGSGSITGSASGNVPGSSTAPQPSTGSSQTYVDQAELARCNGLAGAAREDCVGNLRNRMDMNSGVGARSSSGGRISTGNGVGIAPGNQLPRPMIGPATPAAPNPPMGPGSGGFPQSPGAAGR